MCGGWSVAEVAEAWVTIDGRLRFVLFGLECTLGVGLDTLACEKVFRDAREDQVSVKEYTLHESAGLLVTGRVDEYEPEQIRVRVEGRRGVRLLLGRVVERAEAHFRRMRDASAGTEG
jgi:hypothetical protein